jgi:hypothetical protein
MGILLYLFAPAINIPAYGALFFKFSLKMGKKKAPPGLFFKE